MADRKQRNIQEDSTDGEYSSGSPSTSSRGADPELGVRVSTGDEAYISGTLDDSYVSDPLLNGRATRKPYMPVRSSQMDFRLRYYGRIEQSSGGEISLSEVPQHLVPPEFYQLHILDSAKEGSKTSSIMTIFSVWNTMMGSGLLTLPWGFSEAGLVGGTAVVIIVGLLAWYTCYIVLNYGIKYGEFMDMTREYFGKIGEKIAWVCSLFIFLGALCAYHILMTDSLFTNVQAFRQFAWHGEGPLPDVPYWTSIIAAGIITLFVFPPANLKSFQFLVKLNSVGIICVLYIMGFIIYNACFEEHLKFSTVPLIQPKFYFLGGIMVVSFFIHNAIVPIMKNNANQEKNNRDLGIAFGLVAATYVLVGAFGYTAYHGATIPQDFLNIFSHTNIPAIVARFALLFQLISVYPLLCMIVRIQFFGLLFKSNYPGWLHVLIMNLVIAAVTTLMAMFYPNVGTILRFAGPAIGMLLVFLIPVGIKLRDIYKIDGYFPFWKTSAHIFLVLVGATLLVSQFV